MTIFELVKIALDELYQEGLAEHGDKLDGLVKDQIAYLSSEYKCLDDPSRKRISYKDPATRFAYTYKYSWEKLHVLRHSDVSSAVDGPVAVVEEGARTACGCSIQQRSAELIS